MPSEPTREGVAASGWRYWGIGRGATRKPGRPWQFRSKLVYSRKNKERPYANA